MEDTYECRKITITLVSADSLPVVRNNGLMKVYARVWIKGRDQTAHDTPVANQGGTNPRWNFPIEYTVRESWVHHPQMELQINLYCQRTFGPDRFVGHVIIPLKSLFDQGLLNNAAGTYQVAGTSEGKLNINYNFGEMFLAFMAPLQEVEHTAEPHSASSDLKTTARRVGIELLKKAAGYVANEILIAAKSFLFDDSDGEEFYN